MKKVKFLLIIFLVLSVIKGVNAQDNEPRAKYLNLNYMKATMKEEGYKVKSDYSMGLTAGRTFYVHKNPLAGMIRIGIDWSYLDLNFSQFSENYYHDDVDDYISEEWKTYKIEAGMHVGPSVTVSPVKNLHLNAYFRFAPSYSGMTDSEFSDVSSAYASFYVAGTSVSYSVISLGLENRWGTTKYKGNYDGESYDYEIKMSGPRFYVGFRFK